jgi:hypothetical protein
LQCQAGVSPFQSVRLSHTARPHSSLGYKTSAAYAGTLTAPKGVTLVEALTVAG